MPVQAESDAWIAVPHLRSYNCNRRSTINQFTGHTVAESVKPGTRYSRFGRQRAQLLFQQVIRSIGAAPAIRKQ
jgi:hypothetical protein